MLFIYMVRYVKIENEFKCDFYQYICYVYKNVKKWVTYCEKFPPAISTIFPNSKIWHPLLRSSMLFPPSPLSYRHGSFLHVTIPFRLLQVLFTKLFRMYCFPKYGKAIEFLIKTVYPAAFAIRAWPFNPMGSSSTSIGHHDSTSHAYFPSCFGLKNIIPLLEWITYYWTDIYIAS